MLIISLMSDTMFAAIIQSSAATHFAACCTTCSPCIPAGNGHGTHCGGIIAAKNQGQGIFGVVPGMPLLAIKVLSKDGSGPLENVYNAYKEIIARLQKGEKIVSVNLSLSSQSDDEEAKTYECGLVAKIQAFGTAVAAAAGNDGEALDYNLPAACMQSMTVTSLDVNDNPSYFSNFATVGNAKAGSILAAPGHSIYSTYTGGGYQTLSGTSM
jgi:subtilisin family serine protease